jgi:DNA repair exonuclease SbcCD nuclease subunit
MLTIASTSDVHLGHHNTSTRFIIGNLTKHLFNKKALKGVDLLVIAGDLFDRLLTMDSEDVSQIRLMVAKLILLCHELGIELLILEGTPSHDRGQSSVFSDTVEMFKKSPKYQETEFRVHYVKTLSILRLERLGIDVLCVPDECRPTADQIYEDVKQLLKEKGLTQVDYAVMHGMFGFQLDIPGVHLNTHDEQSYLDIVKYLIFIGHVHEYSSYQRIFSHGSFDRIIHGDEKPKGWLKAVIEDDGNWHVKFVENTDAKIYRTVYLQDKEAADNIEYIEREIKDYPDDSFVRVVAPQGHAVFSNARVFEERWPKIRWSFERKKVKEESSKSNGFVDPVVYVPIVLNKQTIKKAVADKLLSVGTSPEMMRRIDDRLQEVIGEIR